MSRRENFAHRCARCHLLQGLCVCELFPEPKLETRTRLVLFIHRIEDRKPTNTGRLACECLANSEVFVRGHANTPSAPLTLTDGSQPLFLFPHVGATPLADFAHSERPVTLIVPDGSWRQASKVYRRVPGLSAVPCVWLPKDGDSAYRLRSESHEAGLATIEAIARAFGLLEGARVRAALERVFLAFVERTLWSRGAKGMQAVHSSLPPEVVRDPRIRRLPAA